MYYSSRRGFTVGPVLGSILLLMALALSIWAAVIAGAIVLVICIVFAVRRAARWLKETYDHHA